MFLQDIEFAASWEAVQSSPESVDSFELLGQAAGFE